HEDHPDGRSVSDRSSVPRLFEQRAHDSRRAVQERSDRGAHHLDQGRALAARGARDADSVTEGNRSTAGPPRGTLARGNPRGMRGLLALLVASRAYADPWEWKIPDRVEVVAGESGTLPIAITVDRGQAISKDA